MNGKSSDVPIRHCRKVLSYKKTIILKHTGTPLHSIYVKVSFYINKDET